jgi:HSP20 family protein
MNALTRFDPFQDFMPELFRRLARPMEWQADVPGDIRVDVTEHDKDYEVKAEIPGAKKDDIRVSVERNVVSISAEVRKDTEKKSGGRLLVRERSFGSSSRSFSLPHEIDDKAVVAKLEDGVLKLTLPKRNGAGAKAIPVE